MFSTLVNQATPMNESEYEFSAYDPYDVWIDGRLSDDAAGGVSETEELDRLQEVCF